MEKLQQRFKHITIKLFNDNNLKRRKTKTQLLLTPTRFMEGAAFGEDGQTLNLFFSKKPFYVSISNVQFSTIVYMLWQFFILCMQDRATHKQPASQTDRQTDRQTGRQATDWKRANWLTDKGLS